MIVPRSLIIWLDWTVWHYYIFDLQFDLVVGNRWIWRIWLNVGQWVYSLYWLEMNWNQNTSVEGTVLKLKTLLGMGCYFLTASIGLLFVSRTEDHEIWTEKCFVWINDSVAISSTYAHPYSLNWLLKSGIPTVFIFVGSWFSVVSSSLSMVCW